MSARHLTVLTLSLVIGLSVGCSGSSSTRDSGDRKGQASSSSSTSELYNRVGEQKLRAVVSDTVDMSAKDPKVALDRAGRAAGWSATPENVEDFKRGLFQFVAAATGGPQEYRGKDMVTAHKGMNITNEQFDALLSHLQAAMDKNQVPQDAQRQLKQVFDGTRGAIVQQPK
jgi:hemoglobin